MKGYRQKIGLLLYLLGMLLLVPACTDEVVPTPEVIPGGGIDPETGDELVPVILNLRDIFGNEARTYAVTGYDDHDNGTHSLDTAGSAAENRIDSVVAYIFNSNYQCEKIMGIRNPLPPDYELGPEWVKTGLKHIVVVANPQNRVTLPLDTNTVSFATLLRTISDAATAAPDFPFLMTGIQKNVNVKQMTKEQAKADSIPISVERTVAKVTMSFTKSGKAANQNITIQSVTMVNGADRVPLFKNEVPIGTYGAQHNITKTTNKFDPSNAGVVQNSPTYIALADSFYTYESLCHRDTTKGVRFEIKMAVNSSSHITTSRFYLGEYTPPGTNDTLYDVKRNYWYDVKVNIVDGGSDSIKVTIITCPWNEASKIDTVVGTGFDVQVPKPLKLVKYYTEKELMGNEMNFDNSGTNGHYAAIADHSKGAAWIDLKVTSGTPYCLTIKDKDPDLTVASYFSGNAGKGIHNGTVYASTVKTRAAAFDYDGLTIGGAGSKIAFADDSANWQTDWTTQICRVGDGQVHRIWIYRPYVAPSLIYRGIYVEPSAGPVVTLEVADKDGNLQRVREFIVEGRDKQEFPTNSYVLRPALNQTYAVAGAGDITNETRTYIPLKHIYNQWENELFDDDIVNGRRVSKRLNNLSAELQWQQNANFRQNNPVVTNIKIENAGDPENAYLYMEAGVHGNAIVAVKNGSTVCWTYHLWVTEYDPYSYVQGEYSAGWSDDRGGNIFMNRDLGADDFLDPTVTRSGTLTRAGTVTKLAQGFYYQWGRKDPFPMVANDVEMIFARNGNSGTNIFLKNGVETTVPVAVGPSVSSKLRPKANIIATIQNPEMLYNNLDGVYDDDNDLWEYRGTSQKSAYDPCPEGWRVPDENSISSWNDNKGYFKDAGQGRIPEKYDMWGMEHPYFGYFPLSGFLMPSSGSTAYIWRGGGATGYWTALHNPGARSVASMTLQSSLLAGLTPLVSIPSSSGNYVNDKQMGKSVRCVRDDFYIQTVGNATKFHQLPEKEEGSGK